MKLISLNIEGNKHLYQVLPFLQNEMPDVLCLQEIYKNDLTLIEALGYTTHFLPITKKFITENLEEMGFVIATRNTTASQTILGTHYYHDPSRIIPVFENDSIGATVNTAVIVSEIIHGNTQYIIATTHFTWTPDGEKPNDYQNSDMTKLLEYLKPVSPHCLCGDFNIPRHHNFLYNKLLEVYTDTIPSQYTSSLDPSMHKLYSNPERKHLFTDFMVDYLFTQPPYNATDVRLEFGLSDHAAVIATLKKRE
jgi:exonuclease III